MNVFFCVHCSVTKTPKLKMTTIYQTFDRKSMESLTSMPEVNKCEEAECIKGKCESPRYFQYSMMEPQMSSHISRYGGYDGYDDGDDICDICDTNTPQYNCNKCGNSICDDEECSMKFPHYSNTTFFVCMSCADTISLNLVLLIDLGKLKLLKEKIRTGTTCNSACSSRTTSRSSCSNSTISTISTSSLSEVSTPDSHRERHSISSNSSDEFLKLAQSWEYV